MVIGYCDYKHSLGFCITVLGTQPNDLAGACFNYLQQNNKNKFFQRVNMRTISVQSEKQVS